MKKNKLLTVLLFVLPLVVTLIAAAPAGVMVFDGETTAYYSWTQPVSRSTFGWCAPVAALVNYALFALAVVYALTKKLWCVKTIRVLAFAAGCIAVLPIVIQSDVKVVPNVFGAIVLMADWLAAHLLLKEPAAEAKPSGKRLDRL